MEGTILFVKGTGELAVILANSPAVISMRNFTYDGLRAQLTEGSHIIVQDVGLWNVMTSVFMQAHLCPGQTSSLVSGSTSLSSVVQAVSVTRSDDGNEPPRRKRRHSMVL